MKCAKCEGTLRKINIGTVEVDQCDRCAGIWFDIGELQKVLTARDIQSLRTTVDSSQVHDSQRTTCPVCGGEGRMVQCTDLRKHDIHIDTCSVCYGQWLDGGELERLRQKGHFQSISDFFRQLLQ